MKHFVSTTLFMAFALVFSSLSFADVTVNVNGTHYACTPNGGGGGGGNSGTNLCRCRARDLGGNDIDYYLEKYNPQTGQYRQLQSFTRGGGDQNNELDRRDCYDAKEDPACYFADNQLRRSLELLENAKEI